MQQNLFCDKYNWMAERPGQNWLPGIESPSHHPPHLQVSLPFLSYPRQPVPWCLHLGDRKAGRATPGPPDPVYTHQTSQGYPHSAYRRIVYCPVLASRETLRHQGFVSKCSIISDDSSVIQHFQFWQLLRTILSVSVLCAGRQTKPQLTSVNENIQRRYCTCTLFVHFMGCWDKIKSIAWWNTKM